MTKYEYLISDKKNLAKFLCEISYGLDILNEIYDWYCHNICPHRNKCDDNDECTNKVDRDEIIRMWLDSEY